MDYKQLQQYCEDLEYLLLTAVKQEDISSFENEIFVMWHDPIGYQTGSTHEQHLFDAYQRFAASSRAAVKKFMDELDRKYYQLQNEDHV